MKIERQDVSGLIVAFTLLLNLVVLLQASQYSYEEQSRERVVQLGDKGVFIEITPNQEGYESGDHFWIDIVVVNSNPYPVVLTLPTEAEFSIGISNINHITKMYIEWVDPLILKPFSSDVILSRFNGTARTGVFPFYIRLGTFELNKTIVVVVGDDPKFRELADKGLIEIRNPDRIDTGDYHITAYEAVQIGLTEIINKKIVLARVYPKHERRLENSTRITGNFWSVNYYHDPPRSNSGTITEVIIDKNGKVIGIVLIGWTST